MTTIAGKLYMYECQLPVFKIRINIFVDITYHLFCLLFLCENVISISKTDGVKQIVQEELHIVLLIIYFIPIFVI